MIDFERVQRERTPRRVFLEVLVNVPELLFVLYGLKCLVTLHGSMLSYGRGAAVRSLHLAPVAGTLAAIIGLAYIGLGLFLYLSDGNPPPENRGWLWRIGPALVRWGGLAFAVWGYFHADNVMTGAGFDLRGIPAFFLVKVFAFIIGVVALLMFLAGMFQREQVQRELYEQGCKPLHVWWRPAAYWVARYWFSYWNPTGFRFIYEDPRGSMHRAYCFVFRSFQSNPQWDSRRVRWLKDTVVSGASASGPRVYVDSEIIRTKLESSGRQDEPEAPGSGTAH